MAHTTTGEIYISAPVRIINDLQPVLGTGKTDLGDIITHTDINPMSKFKPVGYPSVAPDRTGNWWKGTTSFQEIPAGLVIGNYTCTSKCAWITTCGVKMLGFLSKVDFLRALNPLTNMYHTGDNSPLKDNYSYVPPTGGINTEPFRLLDFNNYWHNATHNTMPDAGTETGTTLINANNPEAQRVPCSVMSYAVSAYGAPSRLSFNDLYGSGTFSLIFGVLTDGNNFNLIGPSTTTGRTDEYFKEIFVNLNDSQVWEKTVIAMYSAGFTHGTDTYYVPLLQSTGDHPNTPITEWPNRKMYNSWRVTRNQPYYAMTMQQKQNYPSTSDFPYTDLTTSSFTFQTTGQMNVWFLKLGIPRPATGSGASTYTFHNGCIKVVFTGEFRNASGRLIMQSYELTSDDTTFVVKSTDPNTRYWTGSETIYVTPGTGTVTCYLQIDNVFADRHAQVVTYGGTVWRVQIFLKKQGQGSFSPEPDLVYGGMDTSTQLHMDIQSKH